MQRVIRWVQVEGGKHWITCGCVIEGWERSTKRLKPGRDVGAIVWIGTRGDNDKLSWGLVGIVIRALERVSSEEELEFNYNVMEITRVWIGVGVLQDEYEKLKEFETEKLCPRIGTTLDWDKEDMLQMSSQLMIVEGVQGDTMILSLANKNWSSLKTTCLAI